MAEVTVKMVLNAPATKTWQIISEFDRVERFAPWVASSHVKGSGVGAERIIVMKDGVQLFEKLEELDEINRILRFSITGSISESPLPLRDYVGTIQVRAMGDNQCEVQWLSHFEPQGVPEAEIVAQIEEMHSLALRELEKLHSS